MKKCVPRKIDRIVSVLFSGFLAVMSAFAFRALARGDESPIACLALGLFWAGTALFLLWRTLRMAGWGVSYDEERVIFALTRADRREYRWEELTAAQVRLVFAPASLYFSFPDGKRLNLLPRMDGYEEFLETARNKGVPAVHSVHVGEMKEEETAAKVFEQMFGKEFGRGGKKR